MAACWWRLAEMALAGGIGATLAEIGDHSAAFGEDQARYVVTSAVADTIQSVGIPMTRIGTTGGDALVVHGAIGGHFSAARSQRPLLPRLDGRLIGIACHTK